MNLALQMNQTRGKVWKEYTDRFPAAEPARLRRMDSFDSEDDLLRIILTVKLTTCFYKNTNDRCKHVSKHLQEPVLVCLFIWQWKFCQCDKSGLQVQSKASPSVWWFPSVWMLFVGHLNAGAFHLLTHAYRSFCRRHFYLTVIISYFVFLFLYIYI